MSTKLLSQKFLLSHRLLCLNGFTRGRPLKKLSLFSTVKFRLSTTSKCKSIKLSVNQSNPLIDEKIAISITGLCPFQEITVMATTKSESKKTDAPIFGSYAHFKATADGCVDLSRSPSVNGTYIGVEPMGLFWSMVQNPNQRQYARLIKYDATTPVVYHVAVYSQHLSSEYVWQPGLSPIAETELHRWYKKSSVKKISVNESGIYGSLFIPEEKVNAGDHRLPFPAVIDLYGTNGGLIESRAALLANHGYITFSLPYMIYKDLSVTQTDLDFEYFRRAIDWFLNHPLVGNPKGIGVIGSSFGGTLALYLATHCPEIKASVSINGPGFFFLKGLKHNGKEIVPGIGVEYCTLTEVKQDVYRNAWEIGKSDSDYFFTVPETCSAKFLVLVGEDDKILAPGDYTRWLESNPASKKSDIELVMYPDTGHLIEPPYTPLFHTCYAILFGCPMVYGGTSAPHAHAQENAWFRIQDFFKKHL